MKKLNIAVIGCGYWGQHILRNFNNSDNWNLFAACDLNVNQINKVKNSYISTQFFEDPKFIFDNPEIDAIAIATPVHTHFDLAKKSLESGKHTWVEKPLCSNSMQGQELINIAKKNNLILNVDHTYIYTSAVQKIKSVIDSGELGDILYFDSIRVNLGLFQHDINVIWDLAPHDLSIIEYCIPKKVKSVSAQGASLIKYSNTSNENIAYLSINFEDDTFAHVTCNWLSPIKIRQIIIGGKNKMLLFDDMVNTEKIKIYDSGVNIQNQDDIYESLIQYRIGDMYSPAISNKEALKEEVEHFHTSIINNTQTITNGESGNNVVKILEAANESLLHKGKLIYIN